MSAEEARARRTGEARPTGDDVPSVIDVVQFCFRHSRWIVGAAVGAALVTFLIVRFLLPPQYESVATLVVAPPSVPGSSRSGELSLQGYKQVLSSDAVLTETRRRLYEAGVLSGKEELELGDDLAVRLYLAERTETPLAPTLELVGLAGDSDDAAAMANTWSRVFLEFASRLRDDRTAEANRFLRAELEAAKEELARLEEKLLKAAERHREATAEAEARWDRRHLKTAVAARDVLADHQVETMEALAAWDSESRRRLTEMAAEVDSTSGALGRMLREVVALRISLAENPAVLRLTRVVAGNTGTPSPGWSGDGLELVEELNPLHEELILRLSRLEAKLAVASIEAGQPAASLLANLAGVQHERTTGRRELRERRAADLLAVIQRQRAGLDEERRRRDRELRPLERRGETIEMQLQAERAPILEQYSRLARSLEEGELGERAQDLRDVWLASAAHVPVAPEPRRMGPLVVVALLLGALGGVVVAVFLDVARLDRTMDR